MSEKLRVIRQLCENWCHHDGKPADVIGEVLAVLDGVDEAPSDPKHLPPRDCHVYVTDDAYGAIWIHALHLPAEMTWCSAETEERLDPSRVITWRDLPEVE